MSDLVSSAESAHRKLAVAYAAIVDTAEQLQTEAPMRSTSAAWERASVTTSRALAAAVRATREQHLSHPEETP